VSSLFDLSHPFYAGMPVYPGDIPVSLMQTTTVERDGYAHFTLRTNLHAGTHLDAPAHFLADGKLVGDFALDVFMGRGCLLDVRGERVIGYRPAYDSLVNPGDIVLLWTNHSAVYGTEAYYADHPVVSEELAEFLIRRRVKILGVDLPSPDKPPFAVHDRVLGANIPLVENLTNLWELEMLQFEVMAFPVRISAEGCPVRVVARVFD